MERRIYYKSEGNLTTIDFTPEVFEEVCYPDVISICNNIKLAAELCDPLNSNRKSIRKLINTVRNQVDQIEVRTGKTPKFQIEIPRGTDSFVSFRKRVIEYEPTDCEVTEPYEIAYQDVVFFNRENQKCLHISGRLFGVLPVPD